MVVAVVVVVVVVVIITTTTIMMKKLTIFEIGRNFYLSGPILSISHPLPTTTHSLPLLSVVVEANQHLSRVVDSGRWACGGCNCGTVPANKNVGVIFVI